MTEGTQSTGEGVQTGKGLDVGIFKSCGPPTNAPDSHLKILEEKCQNGYLL